MLISRDDNGFWYKDGIIYQVHVKAYRDSTNDGIGDFGGLLEKLDYIENLGVTIIWLLPFYPSPLRDDGYDIADYTSIHSDYGKLEDFVAFLKEAHKRNIKVVTELVLNHTSDQHPWFQKSRRSAPGSQQRDFYVWSDTPEKYTEARIIFQDFETSNWTWDPVAKAYYWHRFYSHQPDLNFDNPMVHKVLLQVVDFWFDLGVDGLRLDAVPYLYEREGTNCENLPETHEFLKKLNKHVNSKYKNKMLLAEANQWPEDAVEYFGNGDECQMAFHFPLMPRLFMSIQMEDRFPIVDILEQTPIIPESCQWAMFLRNHDELTLEMVTDEERDYMYRFYATDKRARINLGIRRRLAPLVENNRRKIELLNILLFSFPGTPIIYYGDEIGMGDNYYLGDRNGVRTPMQWSFDKNAGFSEANPQKLYLPVIIDPEYHYEAVNVEIQQRNSSSLLWWMKKAIAIRKNYKAFGNGTIEFLTPANPKVLSFTRKYKDEIILVVANLSRFAQVVELELDQYTGYTPMEAFSRNKYPVIKDSFYTLTLNAYDYYWFILQKKPETVPIGEMNPVHELSFNGSIKYLLDNEKTSFEKILIDYLKQVDWLNGTWANINDVEIIDEIQLNPDANHFLIFIRVDYIDKLSEKYVIPLTLLNSEKLKSILRDTHNAVITKTTFRNEEYILCDGSYDENLRVNLLNLFFQKKMVRGKKGILNVRIKTNWKKHYSNGLVIKPSLLMKSENKNFSFLYHNQLSLKIYRRLEEGKNPGIEIPLTLSDNTFFANFPPMVGSVTYEQKDSGHINFALISEYVNNQGDAWSFQKDSIKRYFDSVLSRSAKEKNDLLQMEADLFNMKNIGITADNIIDNFTIEMIRILGSRTGEMHRELASIRDDKDFYPEPFTVLYQRSIYQAARSLVKNTFRQVRRNLRDPHSHLKNDLSSIESYESYILNFLAEILDKRISTMKIRIHGNYHLRQILFTGKDFVITNFEGNSSAALSERRIKRSALRDVSGMIWSFFFAVFTVAKQYLQIGAEEEKILEKVSQNYWIYLSKTFMSSYCEKIKDINLLPDDEEDLVYLIKFYLIEKMVNELHTALNLNTSWIQIPIRGINYFVNELNIKSPISK